MKTNAPHPATSALAVPTQLLSKNTEVQAWQGTKLAPSIPMKNRRAYNVDGLCAVPARPDAIAPRRRIVAIVFLGPYKSTNGPIMARVIIVDASAMIFELVTCAALRSKSDLMASGINGGKANQERKATKKLTGKKIDTSRRYGEGHTPAEVENSRIRIVESQNR